MQSKKYLATALILAAICAAFYAGSLGFGLKRSAQQTLMPTGQYALSLAGNTYYVDAEKGNDSSPGTSDAPWKSWPKIQGNVSAGDTVYLTGNFGSIAFSQSSPVGTSENWITYGGWPGKTAPHFDYISFGDIFKDTHIKFVNIHVDPGYVEQQTVGSSGVVNLRGANYVTFEDSYFEGEKIKGEAINQGDFAPYVFGSGSSIISAGVSPAAASFITIKNCTFKNGLYGLYIVQHPLATDRRVEHWTIINNDFSDTAEDCIMTSVGGYHYIADNHFHNTNGNKAGFGWPGAPTGDWTGKKWQTVTQDTTNASGIFYEINEDGRFIIFADDADHRPSRSLWAAWRLDSNPGIYFTPSGTGDNCHTDMIAVQGTSHDTVIERNVFHQGKFGAQVIKIEPSAENITFKNNLICIDVYLSAYQMLLGGNNTGIYNNTIVAVDEHPYAVRLLGNTPEKNVYFYNNVVSGAIFSSGSINSNYNIWGTPPPAGFNEGPDSAVIPKLNGLFVDRGNFDFKLALNSTAINFGNPDYAPETDILGNPRDSKPDAGAYEFQGTTQACTEGATRQCGTTDAGKCAFGTQACTAGAWGNCIGAKAPEAEQCTGSLDEDCDSLTDCADSDCAANPACTAECSTDSDCPTGQTCKNNACTTAECIGQPRLIGFISEWKKGSMQMLELMQKMKQWKTGTGC